MAIPAALFRPARQHGDDGIRSQIDAGRLEDSRFAERVKVAADEQRDSAAHRGCRLQQAIVLKPPAGLPVRLGDLRRQPLIAIVHVGIPLAPLAGAPAWRRRRHVDDVRRVRARHACLEPLLDDRRHERRAGPRQRHVPPAVVHQQLEQLAVPQRAEALGNAGRPIGRRSRRKLRPRCASGRNSG